MAKVMQVLTALVIVGCPCLTILVGIVATHQHDERMQREAIASKERIATWGVDHQ